jgi:hypothetical protein
VRVSESVRNSVWAGGAEGRWMRGIDELAVDGCSALGRERGGDAGREQVRSGQHQGGVSGGSDGAGAEREDVVHRDVGNGRDECDERVPVGGEGDLQGGEQEAADIVGVDEVEHGAGEQPEADGHRCDGAEEELLCNGLRF